MNYLIIFTEISFSPETSNSIQISKQSIFCLQGETVTYCPWKARKIYLIQGSFYLQDFYRSILQSIPSEIASLVLLLNKKHTSNKIE